MHEEVVEIDGVGPKERALIGGIGLSDAAIKKGADAVFDLLGEGLGSDESVFGDTDPCGDLADGDVCGLLIDFGEDFLEDGALVGRIEDGEIGLQSDGLAVMTEESGAEAVEGTDPDLRAGDEPGDAFGHFVGGLVGEGDGEDLAG